MVATACIATEYRLFNRIGKVAPHVCIHL